MEKYKQLKDFREKNRHCDVPGKENKDLHDWAVRQRREFAKKNECVPYSLSEERIKLLEQLDFDFASGREVKSKRTSLSSDQMWDVKFKELKEFFDEYGHTQVNFRAMNKTHSLTTWAAYLRSQYLALQEGKPSILNNERIALLEALNFQWKKPSSLPRKNCGTKRRKAEKLQIDNTANSETVDNFEKIDMNNESAIRNSPFLFHSEAL